MHGPPLVAWLLVVLSAAAAVICLVRGQAGHEAVTSTGMALMAVPMSVVDPWSWEAPLLAVLFTLTAVRALLLSGRRTGHHVHHAVCSAAMVYMAVCMARADAGRTGPPGHEAHTTAAGLPLLTGLLLLYFAGYALRAGMLLVAAPAHGPLIPADGTAAAGANAAPRFAPEVAVACRILMALAMLAMLLTL
ncbi:DUF5134 domain-containing protein [Streptomyces sp. HPF1205]|uniref:DUF5134 domain-containing protein n=1 Tax=Streptomyces sp. HPF1205 TaxID=2873262 RepID=UPI001CEC8F9A|nr:DUF5134 domain-containing protein [Streptomyces sp. HPF1205]